MSQPPKIAFSELKNELINFQKKDALVHFPARKHLWKKVERKENQTEIRVPFETVWEKLFRRFESVYKESGVQTACFVTHSIKWLYQDEWIESPLCLIPLDVVRDRNRNEILFTLRSEEQFLNPFIQKEFQQQFDVELTLENWTKKRNVLSENPRVEGIFPISIIGQFHYHRFLFLKELEQLETSSKSAVLERLFGNPADMESVFEWSKQEILPVDPTQRKVLEQVGKGSFIIQGPPGTGKSQVLINILGISLQEKEKLVAVVSEKRSALEVIRKKLSPLQLSDFTVFLDDQISLQQVYEQFKMTWKRLESAEPETHFPFSVTSLKMQQLQQLLERIQQENLSSGISFWELLTWKNRVNTSFSPDSFHSISLAEWKEIQPKINALSEIPFALFTYFPLQFWKTKNLQEFETWTRQLNDYSAIFNLKTRNDVENLLYWNIIKQIHTTQNFSEFVVLVKSQSKWKKYQKTKKEYYVLKAEKEFFEAKTKSWEFIPESSKLAEWKSLETSFLGRKKWKTILASFPSTNDFAELEQIATDYAQFLLRWEAIQKSLAELAIYDAERDFLTIDLLKERLDSVAENAWKSFEQLSVRQREFLAENSAEISTFTKYPFLQYFPENNDLFNIISLVQRYLPLINANLGLITSLPKNVYFWTKHHDSWEAIEQQLITNEWNTFSQLFPEMSTLTLEDVRQRIREILSLQEEDRKWTLRKIYLKRKALFDEYHAFLQTSNLRKLTDEQKMFRQLLKRGKSLLVKELNKTRQHLPLRDLWQSDAQIWLRCLAPIWLLTPTQLAKHFPLKKSLFDCALVDEASQIPLTHLLGTLQRSEQVIIAGDRQQMAPSAFFQSGSQLDVLSWAEYFLKNQYLRYHYRSKDAALISFSNRYFYEGKLEVFPQKQHEEKALERIFVAQGVYENQVNLAEAKVMVEQIAHYLKTDKTLGIVAFSENQLQAIWNALDAVSRQKLQAKIDDELAFFKALDKVQGDECAVLLISFGYGRDENGVFKLHLGPILNQNGEKRLNVLFSRAKEKIVFVSSVTADDFSLSENNTIQLLKQFFYLLEQPVSKEKNAEQSLESWLKTMTSAEELVAKYSIFTERGWKI